MGDGRAVFVPVIREYLAGHALNALGIASSNAVGFTSSTQGIQREKLEPGAMMLRTSDCHIRFGTFRMDQPISARPSRRICTEMYGMALS